MSIATELTKLQNNLSDSYTAVSNKGGTLPQNQCFDNLPTAINSITTGITPSGTINITTNNTYDVTNYASAVVNVDTVNNTNLSVTPLTTAQSFTVSSPYTGYYTVSVSAVTSSIDSNIKASNIKSGISILGVSGSVVELNADSVTINPSTSSQTITPTSPVNGFDEITVNPVTSSIDANITAENIKKDVTILGVTGTYKGEETDIFNHLNENYIIINGNIEHIQLNSYILGAKDTVISTSLQNAYKNNINVENVSLGYITSINGNSYLRQAFYNCSNLKGKVDLSSLTTISGSYSCNSAFNRCTSLTSVDLSSLTTISGGNALSTAFSGCTSLTNVDLSSLTTVSGSAALDSAFNGCTSLTNVDLSSLTTVSTLSHIFQSCTSLTSVDLSSLTTVSGSYAFYYAFYDCTLLTSVDLSSLTTISVSSALLGMLTRCTSLATLSFPALTSSSFGSYTNQFNSMLYGVTGCTVHFPSNLQSVIGNWSDVTAGFDGTNTTVLFDLTATT